MTNRITYQIQFFSSLHCHADIPLPQSTFEKSPIRSFEETIKKTNEETLRITFERTLDETIGETIKETEARTYDSKCEMKMLSSDVVNRMNNINMFPIFISLVNV